MENGINLNIFSTRLSDTCKGCCFFCFGECTNGKIGTITKELDKKFGSCCNGHIYITDIDLKKKLSRKHSEFNIQLKTYRDDYAAPLKIFTTGRGAHLSYY